MTVVCLLSQRWERGGCFPGGGEEDLPEHSGRQSGSERSRIRCSAQTISATGRPDHQWTPAAAGGVWLLMTIIIIIIFNTRPGLGPEGGRCHGYMRSLAPIFLFICPYFLLSVFLFPHHPPTNHVTHRFRREESAEHQSGSFFFIDIRFLARHIHQRPEKRDL